MMLVDGLKEILKIQRLPRIVGYTCFYSFATVIDYAYTSNTARAGYSRGDQFYASYSNGTELLTDTPMGPHTILFLYKATIGNCFESEELGPVELCILGKHFERKRKSPYAYDTLYMAHLLSRGELDGSG